MAGFSQSRRRHLKKRQDNPLQVPTVSGIDQSSSLVVGTTGANSANTLALDTTASTLPTQNGIPLAGTFTPVITSTVVGADTPTASTSPPPTANPAHATSILSLRTVIASCIAAFVGALFLVLIGLGLYRRYMRSLKKSYTSPRGRNAAGEADRRRSHLQPWSRLGDEKRGEGQTKDADGVAPMEKMFKTSPSVRTAYTHKSDEPMTLEMPLSLAQYHPQLAKNTSQPSEVTVHRPFLGRAESGLTISWDADTMNENAVTSQHLSTSSAGNTASIAIPTPVATRTLHRWQSAEVINPDTEGRTSDVNPFESETERRRSRSNPFFKGSDYPAPHMRTRSNSTTSNKSSKDKDPSPKATSFASDVAAIARPPFAHHVPSTSKEQALNNTHAIKSLIKALDVTEKDIQDRLRVVSMQPSMLTTDSIYTEEGEALASSFPLPPRGGNIEHQ
ncbi:hypothetical protein AX15_005320 [Amanita polypyramis BW_CC]|nr:hypothetical protein AX15_005320 [Amanita polypyramis BW_CC]